MPPWSSLGNLFPQLTPQEIAWCQNRRDTVEAYVDTANYRLSQGRAVRFADFASSRMEQLFSWTGSRPILGIRRQGGDLSDIDMVDIRILGMIHEDPHHVDPSWKIKVDPTCPTCCTHLTVQRFPQDGEL